MIPRVRKPPCTSKYGNGEIEEIEEVTENVELICKFFSDDHWTFRHRRPFRAEPRTPKIFKTEG